MARLKKMPLSKAFAVLLVFLLLHGPSISGENNNLQARFAAALKFYRQGAFAQALAELAPFSNSKEKLEAEFQARVYLLSGACYEKSGQEDKAKNDYLVLKGMLAEGSIDRPPVLPGIAADTLPAFREVFAEDSFFEFKQPVAVSEMISKRVVHAPRKSIEQKEKEKKKKKFPWLIAIGAVVLAGTTAVLLLTQKRGNRSADPPRIEWVRIPAGEFLMGDNFKEGETDELPVHPVYLDEYYISEKEITFDQYNCFCAGTGRDVLHPPRIGFKYEISSGELPVYNVTWDDAAAFCEWYSARTGQNVRLPTEAQWEKAARGTYQYRYPWGNEPARCDLANYFGCPGVDGAGVMINIYPVGFLPSGVSPYGVCDMAGNAAEWCRDFYSASYYAVSPAENPQGPAQGSLRVVRGGGYNSYPEYIRSASRVSRRPGDSAEDLGFRMVKEN